jgi:formate/nitrite transporter FocA (FNT family)
MTQNHLHTVITLLPQSILWELMCHILVVFWFFPLVGAMCCIFDCTDKPLV